MTQRALINMVLLALIAVAAGWLYFTGPEDQPVPPAVADIDPAGIDRISVTRAGAAELRFQKQGDGWRMLAPMDAPANPVRVQAILAVLQARSHAQYAAATLDLAALGLRDPAVTLQLNNQEFLFGDKPPLDDTRYLRHGDTVHVINDGLFQQLQQSPVFFSQTPKG